ncbi:endonuclease domain-containing protein [Pseudonocardia endophytica]|uniref:Uncharacterized protein DUF559 n=1 Tax=Pseudonocardia endophytica TaxID=401976 RepID=A0A4V2PJ31_PSEEN|nr:DUF559 domain-containing protein [Pseudonocardia endophytica]TCK26956.1 uncharacterized protein DUF559 [Pseudonocardia endophytica]
MTVPGFPTAFRGSAAVDAGLVTWSVLRGPRFDRLLPDIYGVHQDEPRDLALRSRAAFRWGGDRGVLVGHSAAELLGADCSPWRAPAELAVPGGGLRSRDGVIVRRDRLHPGEIAVVGDVRTTTPMRTAFDLGCRSGLVEGVVAVDALARVHRFPPDLLVNFAVRYARARGVYRFTDVLAFCDRKAGSPPESRLRMLLVLSGLPRPVVQHPVLDDDRRRAVWLDLAYPEHRVGVEYDGGEHLKPEQVRKDIARHTRLVAAGWRVFRYTSQEIRNERDRIVADVAEALALDVAALRLR